jgi:hypothetical protein
MFGLTFDRTFCKHYYYDVDATKFLERGVMTKAGVRCGCDGVDRSGAVGWPAVVHMDYKFLQCPGLETPRVFSSPNRVQHSSASSWIHIAQDGDLESI